MTHRKPVLLKTWMFKTWMFVYAGLVASATVAGKPPNRVSGETADHAAAVLGQLAPDLKNRSASNDAVLVKRSDI